MAATTANSRHIKIADRNNRTEYQSYDTVIGIAIDGTLYLTTQRYSATTSRHGRKFAFEFDGPVVHLDAPAFRALRAS